MAVPLILAACNADPAPPEDLVGATPVLDASGEVTAFVLQITTCHEMVIDTAEVRSVDYTQEPPAVLGIEAVDRVDQTLGAGSSHVETVELDRPSTGADYSASFFSDGLNYGVRVREAQTIADDQVAVAEGVIDQAAFEEQAATLCS